MKKTFLTKRNALLIPGNFSWGSYALGLVLILLVLRMFAPNVFWQMMAPVFRAADAFGNQSHFFLSSFGDRAALTLENERLHSENAILRLENQTLTEKIASYTALLGSSPIKSSSILADVLMRPPESPYDVLLLAAGTRGGVALGMGAFAAPVGESNVGVLVGFVSSATADFSRVTLFSSPGIQTAAWVGPTKIPLILTGSGGGVLSAALSRSAAVNVGDLVFGPGSGTTGLGTVSRIDSDPSSPSVVLRILPVTNPFSISTILLRDVGATISGAVSLATSTLP